MARGNWRRLCRRNNLGPVGVMLQSIQAALLAILDAPMRIMRKRIRLRAPPPPPATHHRRVRSEPISPEFLHALEDPKDR
jgi:hypothetical protein